MKTWMVLWAAVLAWSTHAGTVTLIWNPNPPSEHVISYRVYLERRFTNAPPAPPFPLVTNYSFLGETTQPTFTWTNTVAGPHCFVVNASNLAGVSGFSWPACAHLYTNSPPAVVQGVSIEVIDPGFNAITVTFTNLTGSAVLESSQDLESWVAWLTLEGHGGDFTGGTVAFRSPADAPRRFWRLRPI